MKEILQALIDRAAGLRMICWGTPEHIKRKSDAKEVGQLVMSLPPEKRAELEKLKSEDVQVIHKLADLDPGFWYRKDKITQREKRSRIFTYKFKK